MRGWILIPLAVVVVVLVGLPLFALTDSGIETDVKSALGFDDGQCVPTTDLASPWSEGQPLAELRDEPRIAVIGGKPYLVGGILAVSEESDGRLITTPTDQLTRFDPSTEAYEELAPLPEPLSHVGVVAHDGALYVLGGYGERVDANTSDHFYRYDPASDRWTRLSDLPAPRAAMAVGVIDDRLIMAGGALDRVATATTFAYDFGSEDWSRLPDMGSKREHVGEAVADRNLYVLGGRGPESLAVDTAERFNAAANRWEALAPMPIPAGGLAAVANGDSVIAIGGGDDGQATITNAVQEFDPSSDSWSELPGLRTASHGQGATVVGNRIWVFGGSACPYFAATDRVEWLPLPSDPKPES